MEELKQTETIEEYLMRLGYLKESGQIKTTWDEIASILNEAYDENHGESYYRKLYKTKRDQTTVDVEDNNESIKALFNQVEKSRIRMRDERAAMNRKMREDARRETVLDIFREEIKTFEPPNIDNVNTTNNKTNKAVYVLLSDIHYGLQFDNLAGKYNKTIAWKRMREYANVIIEAGKANEAESCYVSLLGDLVSGLIHPTIRIENRENVINQVIGASEMVCDFLYTLSKNFKRVIFNSVSGNHSRLDPNIENTLKGERLDALIPWYAETKFENFDNVSFGGTKIDDTISEFFINGSHFVSIHGDFDRGSSELYNYVTATTKIPPDYVVCGHMHVPKMDFSNTPIIQNGCLCGSGDEYSTSKRYSTDPYQVFMIINSCGKVESIHPVNLKTEELIF